jgi:hypothetical protein
MNFKELKAEAKCKMITMKFRAQNDIRRAKKWVEENPELAVIIGGTVVGGAKFVCKNGAQHAKLNKAQKVKELYLYDPSMGHYWELSRKLSNREYLIIDQRRANGERMANILDDMGVLKGKRFGL